MTDEPPTVATAVPELALQPVTNASASVDASAGAARRRPRLGWRILRVILLVVLLPAIALGIGLLVAYVVHEIRGNSSIPGNGDTSSAAPLPSASGSASATSSPAASASAPPQVVVPASWITETSPPVGLTYRHPAGWIRRTASPEVLRFAPETVGSQAPGVDGVGAGFEAATDPAQALRSFAARAYGTQPGFVAEAVSAVDGQHPEEQQEVVTYTRSGLGVRVVLRSFRLQGHTVLVLGRSLNSQPARAAQLESQVEASLKFS